MSLCAATSSKEGVRNWPTVVDRGEV